MDTVANTVTNTVAVEGTMGAVDELLETNGPVRTIGFIAPNVHGYFFGGLLAGVLETAATRRCRVVAIQTHDAGISVFEDERFTAELAWDHLDALLVTQAAVDSGYLRRFAETGKPVVTLYEAPEDFDCPTIVPDNQQGIRAAIGHLVAHGHTEIAFIGRDPANADDEIRYQAYRDAMSANKLEPLQPVLVPWQLDETYDATDAVHQLHAAGRLPTAALACTDVTAIAIMSALAEAGIAVPDDIAVIGFDDIAEAAECEPPLTTVAQSFRLAGATACTMALDAIEGRPHPNGLRCTPVHLVVRESCSCRGTDRDPAPSAPGLAEFDERFATDLRTALYGQAEPTTARQRGLRTASHRLVSVFADVAMSDQADVPALADAAAESLRRLVTTSPNLLALLEPVQSLAAAMTGLLDPGDGSGAARLERLAYAVSNRLFRSHRCHTGQAIVNQHVEIQRRYNMISTDLVRRYHGDFRNLSWMDGTEISAGCMALWHDGRGGSGGDLRIVGRYTTEEAGRRLDVPCRPRAFPDKVIMDWADRNPEHLVYLQPIRFDGSDWGFLAMTGAFDVLEEAVFERFNHWAVLLTVVLDQERATRAERTLHGLRLSEERYALAAEAANDGLFDWNIDAGATYYSSRWKALLGYAEDEIAATPDEWLKRVHPDDRETFDRALADHLEGRPPTLELEYRMRTASDEYRWMLTNSRSVRDSSGKVTRVVGAMTDITERKRLEDRLRHDAHYDALTGLPNRTLFLDRLNQAIARSKREPGYQFAVVFLDLDSFKVVNDSLGHQIGDEVLTQVAMRLVTEIRMVDTVCRFGGDEFVLLLDDVRTFTDRPATDLPAAVQRLLRVLSVPLDLDGHSRAVSVAAGIAVSDGGERTPDEYVRDADTAMYRAKAIGPGSVVLFDEAMHTRAMARLHLESDLDSALTGDQFELHYQPIVRLDDRVTVGFEALLRWQHPERGLLTPDQFLDVAEATGQTRQLGKWTIDEVCRQLSTWSNSGGRYGDFTVSINLSNRQFWDPGLRETLAEALAKFDVPPARLVFEVTEGVIMHNREAACELMRQLRADGVGLHIDDFGTGYSSLSALHTFPIDALKIDRSFVTRMRTDTRSRELLHAMINMGSILGITVIVEGIESEAEALALADLGNPMVQGYLFARPTPPWRVRRP